MADDVPANLAVARALLEAAGHRVHCVADGALAVRAVQEAQEALPFDVVLMDVMMPNLDGMEATRQIRALPGPGARVPILAVTASAFVEDIAACSEAGMDAHLAKPIEREALIAALGRLTGAPPPGAVAPSPGHESFARLPLLSRRAGEAPAVPGLDPEAARSLAGEFVREMRDAAEQLRGIDQAMPDRMVPAAHRLAGAAATLGATRLAAAARQFQADARRLPPEAMLRQREGAAGDRGRLDRGAGGPGRRCAGWRGRGGDGRLSPARRPRSLGRDAPGRATWPGAAPRTGGPHPLA
ncbi:response regulator [Dankookia sp. P2]|uniref:response regulator n=1 Tax=Dankookia sp. P2 TaxID=3423955 RepID=UPI003D6785EE